MGAPAMQIAQETVQHPAHDANLSTWMAKLGSSGSALDDRLRTTSMKASFGCALLALLLARLLLRRGEPGDDMVARLRTAGAL